MNEVNPTTTESDDRDKDVSVDANNPDLKENQKIYGYVVKRILEIKEIRSWFYELEHPDTGARHIHISNQDRENTFSVALKTVPNDSTGAPHILEHTVLCGSTRYPVRDPFFSMLKRSLSTFMNAFTSSDWTMYPFATQNRTDFYNLMDVYLDAVFFPKLDRLSFRQEGFRIEVTDGIKTETSPTLSYKGVVYNEMKGAMSSPDQVLVRSLFKALYPSTPYRFNSGGDPAVIPTLTHEQLKAFHRRHYHPSNAYFYTYGNLPLKQHLSFIQEKILNRFERIDPQTEVPSQPRLNHPKQVTGTYPLEKNEDPSKKSQVTVAWLTADILDTFEVLSLILLEQILLGHAAAPLRKALIDSGLGTTLCDGTGFSADHRDTFFGCGLKDVAETDAEKIEAIVFQVLQDLVQKGIDKELIESAIHQIEFHRKEVTNSPYPYGIKLLLIFSGSWFHGGDPIRLFRFDDDLKHLRDKLSAEPFFENQIQKYLIDNSHRVRLTLVPDQLLEQKEGQRVFEELLQIGKKMSASDIEQLQEDAAALKRLQETAEDVSCLPTLAIKDIPPEPQIVKETDTGEDLPATTYVQPTGGIFYVSAAAGAGLIPEALQPMVPFFCYTFSKVGTKRRDYTDMSQRIALYTGGVGMSAHARTGFEDNGACLPFVTLNGKCLVRNVDHLLDIIEELLFQFDFSDLERLKNLLLDYRAGLESKIVHNGHRLAISLASRNFSAASALSESWHGVHQLQSIKRLSEDLSRQKLQAIADDLKRIGSTLFSKNNVRLALIGEAPAVSKAGTRVRSLIDGLADAAPDGFTLPDSRPGETNLREGWSTASAVSFVACSFQTVRLSHPDAPALSVISKLLRSLFLHREIREKGGAYGGLAVYNSEDGLFSLASYRDPHIASTLDVYQRAMSFIRSTQYDEEDLAEAILQVCSDIDKPDPPGPAAQKAFYRKIISLSDDARLTFKKRLLSLTLNNVRDVAKRYFHTDMSQKAVAVISGEERLKEANRKMSSTPLKLFRI